MTDFQLPGVVGLPGAYKQAKRQVIEPAGEQHFLAAEQVFESVQRQEAAAAFRAGQVPEREKSRSDQQHDGRSECYRLCVLPFRGEDE